MTKSKTNSKKQINYLPPPLPPKIILLWQKAEWKKIKNDLSLGGDQCWDHLNNKDFVIKTKQLILL